MSFRFLNEGQRGNVQEFTPIDTFIDPVSKIRVSNPSNLIDTDFEYGLQPTKWETVELINNTPAFFSKSGDTTISDITGITTNSGTREVTVTTAFPHNLAVGIPIRVSGTKSVTADGSYIINATPTDTTFTYLARANQEQTISIFDLYTSVITGEFFQGSQISIDDAEGIVTNSAGPTSTLTVKTPTKHGFGLNTPFYFLNLNSTISQEFESQNSASLSFDPSNSATAQTFDGSNTLLQTPIDLSNSATTSNFQSIINSTNPIAASITVALSGEDWSVLKIGSPLYHSVSVGGGYFQQNPRGVVFIKNVDQINQSGGTATFQVSQLPDGPAIPILANMTGFFQIANQARTFAGNNVNSETQIDINIEAGQEFLFDGGNRGYDGELSNPPSNTSTVVGYTGTTMTVFTSEGQLDYYQGAMLKYSTNGDTAVGLVNNSTYFVTQFSPGASSGLYTMSVAELPDGPAINISGGSGTQTFSKIGVSIDKNIVHVRNSGFEDGDMLEYKFPNNGNFGASSEKIFYFVEQAFDTHNYTLTEEIGYRSISATGGNLITQAYDEGRFWKIHHFTTPGAATFSVQSLGKEDIIQYLIIGGGGAGGDYFSGGGYNAAGGGGGAGGVISGQSTITAQNYAVTVGSPGVSTATSNTSGGFSSDGGSSSFLGLTALGGGRGGAGNSSSSANSYVAGNGASGGGGVRPDRAANYANAGTGTSGQGNNGGAYSGDTDGHGGGGGGFSSAGQTAGNFGTGGTGFVSSFTGFGSVYAVGGTGGRGFSGFWSGLVAGDGTGGGRGGLKTAASIKGGSANTFGSGGGGAGSAFASGDPFKPGGNGGSGAVLVRYPITEPQSLDFMVATGGTVSLVNQNNITYAVHEFKNAGTSNFGVLRSASIPSNNEVEYLVIGGGGGGGAWVGGGGGAGGYRSSVTGELSGANTAAGTKVTVSTGNYPVVVGAGGRGTRLETSGALGSTTSGYRGDNGGNSSVFGIVSIGGGRGGSWTVNNVLSTVGGSGGGGSGSNNPPSSGTTGQGFAGGGGTEANTYSAGGGGGAGQIGVAGNDNNGGTGGNGGNGIASSITGVSIFRAGGGGGGVNTATTVNSTPGNGGSGGGGRGSRWNPDYGSVAFDGLPGSGSGGGGSGQGSSAPFSQGGVGGSGAVILRYPIGKPKPGPFVVATGGSVSLVQDSNKIYAVHEFSQVGSSSFNIISSGSSPENNQIEYLVVAGGGGVGSRRHAGGGGGGGVRSSVVGNSSGGGANAESFISAQPGNYSVVVGNGGFSAHVTGQNFQIGATGGENSSVFGITSIGGGLGTTYAGGTGGTGGSGGGTGSSNGATTGGVGTAGQGRNGGAGQASTGGGGGGGGGGASLVGGNGSGENGGAGGNGVISTIQGFSSQYGGGGGGGGGSGGVRGAAGQGGGGIGGNSGLFSGPGIQNTGGGAGGGNPDNVGPVLPRGGSGIVIIRYPIGRVN